MNLEAPFFNSPCPAWKGSSCIADAGGKPSLTLVYLWLHHRRREATVHARRYNVICIVAPHQVVILLPTRSWLFHGLRKEWGCIVSQFRSLLLLFVTCFLSTFASAGSERLTVAYPQWPPYKIVQNGTIGGIDALMLDKIARRTGLEFDYVECPWARCLIMLQNLSLIHI